MEFIGGVLDTIGEIMVAYTAIAVHHRFRKEHKIDEAVFLMMKREQFLGILGIIFIIVGSVIKFFA